MFNTNILQPGQTIVIGLSGGPDSVYLLHQLVQLRTELNLTLIAAHLDHQWRENSADDVQFCQNLCDGLGVQFVHAKAEQFAGKIEHNGSKEEVGRKLRRLYFESLVIHHNAQAITLAHHLQDQEETFFIRMVRGTTLSGLTCMKAKDGLYIRPMLTMGKEEIIAHLDAQNIKYLVDPTNESPNFLRNRVRGIIPALRACDRRFDQNFLRMLTNLQQDEELLNNYTERVLRATMLGDAVSAPQLGTLSPHLKRRVVLAWLIRNKVPFAPTERFLEEIIRFIDQPAGGEHKVAPTWSVVKKKGLVRIQAS